MIKIHETAQHHCTDYDLQNSHLLRQLLAPIGYRHDNALPENWNHAPSLFSHAASRCASIGSKAHCEAAQVSVQHSRPRKVRRRNRSSAFACRVSAAHWRAGRLSKSELSRKPCCRNVPRPRAFSPHPNSRRLRRRSSIKAVAWCIKNMSTLSRVHFDLANRPSISSGTASSENLTNSGPSINRLLGQRFRLLG